MGTVTRAELEQHLDECGWTTWIVMQSRPRKLFLWPWDASLLLVVDEVVILEEENAA